MSSQGKRVTLSGVRSSRAFLSKVIETKLEEIFTLASAENLARLVKSMFLHAEVWAFDASGLRHIDKTARGGLLDLLKQFKAAGGKEILLHSKDPLLNMVFQAQLANQAGLKLTLEKDKALFDARCLELKPKQTT